MGWLWSSASSTQPTTQNSTSSPPNVPSPAPPTPVVSTSTPSSSAPNEPVDPEIQKFFDLLSSEASATSSESQLSRQQKQDEIASATWLSRIRAPKENLPTREVPNAPRRDPLSEALLPTEMSCRQAFDLAWSCNSIGGQWNAVYRYGNMRSCSEQWNDFWFCMRTKNQSGPVKEEMIRAHYRNKEHDKYYAHGKHNSEEIWDARPQKAAPGSVFAESIEPPDVSDDEWREMENDRRRNIRKNLGFSK